MSRLTYALKDAGAKSSNVSVTTVDLTGANEAAEDANRIQFENALNGITLGTLAKYQWLFRDVKMSSALPGSNLARRSIKWLARYHDNVTGEGYELEIPTADLSIPMTAGTDFADLTQGAGQAFKVAWDDFVRSPEDATNQTTLDSLENVGRNI